MPPWKLSQFTIPIHDYPCPGSHVLYQTLTRSTVRIDAQGWQVLSGLPDIPSDPRAQSWLKALAQNEYIVPANLHEGSRYIEKLDAAKNDTHNFHVTLSLIQSCNFGCTYCYQGGAI